MSESIFSENYLSFSSGFDEIDFYTDLQKKNLSPKLSSQNSPRFLKNIASSSCGTIISFRNTAIYNLQQFIFGFQVTVSFNLQIGSMVDVGLIVWTSELMRLNKRHSTFASSLELHHLIPKSCVLLTNT